MWVQKYKATEKFNIVFHMLPHTGKQRLNCTLCQYKASHNGNLTDHIRTYSGEEPFHWTLCNDKGA